MVYRFSAKTFSERTELLELNLTQNRRKIFLFRNISSGTAYPGHEFVYQVALSVCALLTIHFFALEGI